MARPIKKKNRFLRYIRTYKSGVIAFCIVMIYVFLAIFGNMVAPYNPRQMDFLNTFARPSLQHPFGTDELGRDLFSMVITSTSVTLMAAMGSLGIGILTGVPLGLIAGYKGGLADTIIMRICEMLLALPPIILAMVLLAVLGGGTTTVIIAIGIANFPRMARMVRSAVIKEKGQEYVEAARALGGTEFYVMFRCLLPNCLSTIIIYASLYAAVNIKVEASLSFLGLGLQPPAISWGYILRAGYYHILNVPWYVTFPGLNIFILVLSLNLVGDTLRDILDPRLKGLAE